MFHNLLLENHHPDEVISGGLIFKKTDSVAERAPLMLRLLSLLYFVLFMISLILIKPIKKK